MKKLFIILTLLLLLGCNQNIYQFNFSSKWKWDALLNNTKNYETMKNIEDLKSLIGLQDARMLLKTIAELESPAQINKLYNIQLKQDSLGGSFYGLAPNLSSKSDSIPLPIDFDSLIKTALYLTEVRTSNLDAISKTEYPIDFLESKFIIKESELNNSGINIAFDYSCIDETLNLFNKKSIELEEAHQISILPGFREMLRHRRNLGYIPEPLPTEESLAKFIYYAASKEPIHMIWKWINPWNYFNLSDIYLNIEKYSDVLSVLKDNESSIVNYISNKYSPFIPKDFSYTDTLTIAYNWGIRSWATNNQFGTNIVQFKDDYTQLLKTLTHEGFHRLQLQLCPVNPTAELKNNRDFEDIVSYTFPSYQDSLFYETLSYVFLEGTASYVGGMDSTDMSIENAIAGLELLQNIYDAVYIDKNFDLVDELNNTGLISNGPFYALGYHITDLLISNIDKIETNKLLLSGSLSFFNSVVHIRSKLESPKMRRLQFSGELDNKIVQLSNSINLKK